MRSGFVRKFVTGFALSVLVGVGVVVGSVPQEYGARAAEFVPPFIDTHFHAHPHLQKRGSVSFDVATAAKNALTALDAGGIRRAVVLPPPFNPDNPHAYDYKEMRRLVALAPDRLAFMAGGGSLNRVIHATPANKVLPSVRRLFETEARAILGAGAVGFGEMTAMHLSFRDGHPFLETAPDHPLFLLLADIAAEAGVPIDLHMEAVVTDRPIPKRAARRSSLNPPGLIANIAALERLLAHNRGAKIIWAHAGWDNTGERTPELMRPLLVRHANLFMAFKLRYPVDRPERLRRDPANPMAADGGIKPAWLDLIRDFPERFVIGSDTHVFVKPKGWRDGIERVTDLVSRLPPDLAQAVGRENAERLFRLP